jgi:hypothetical protein
LVEQRRLVAALDYRDLCDEMADRQLTKQVLAEEGIETEIEDPILRALGRWWKRAQRQQT